MYWQQQYELQFGVPQGDAFGALFQSDLSEQYNYFLSLATYKTFVFPVFFIFIQAIFLRLHRRNYFSPSDRLRKKLTLCSALAFLVSLYFSHSAITNYTVGFRKAYFDFKTSIVSSTSAVSTARKAGKTVGDVKEAEFNGTVIFIIGESTTKRHMSLYGYFRPTTPNLVKWKNSLLVHNDTISPHSHTVPVLSTILTQRELTLPYAEADIQDNLIEKLKRSGFHTWWLSNQNETGIWENPTTLLAKQADEVVFIRSLFGKVYDHQLIPLLENALMTPSPKKVIFLHLYATHLNYCSHIPPQFRDELKADELGPAYFGKAVDRSESVNCYDNAVRYVDSIIGKIFDIASKRSEPTAVVYLSDHGDNPSNGTGHNSARHSIYHIEIPHIWYFNEAAIHDSKDKIDNLRSHLDAPYISSGQDDMLLDFIGADDSLYSRNRSLFSTSYKIPANRKTIPSEDRYVDYDDLSSKGGKDFLEITRLNLQKVKFSSNKKYSKIWARHVNTLGKLGEAARVFSGVELDIVYDSKLKRFDVYHPPKEPHGLTLDTYLKATNHYPELHFWFDWKNASLSNIAEAVGVLNDLDDRYKIKNRTLVETSTDSVFEDLRVLSKNGFSHAYYLPTQEVIKCGKDPHSSPCEALKDMILHNIKMTGANYISVNLRGMPFIRAYPKVFSSYNLAVWSMKNYTNNIRFVNKLPNLDEVDIFLASFPSLFSD